MAKDWQRLLLKERDRVCAALRGCVCSTTEKGYGNHPAEAGTEWSIQMEAAALKVMLKGELEQIKAALHRLESGTYGLCTACGRKIPKERLQALPYTPFCVICAGRGRGRGR